MQWWRVITQWGAEAEPASEEGDDAHSLSSHEGTCQALRKRFGHPSATQLLLNYKGAQGRTTVVVRGWRIATWQRSSLKKRWLGRVHLTAGGLYLKEGYRRTQSQTSQVHGLRTATGTSCNVGNTDQIFPAWAVLKYRSRGTWEVLPPPPEIFRNNKLADPCLKLTLL